jgi:hypothetical protein
MRSSWMMIWLPCHSCVACSAFRCATVFFSTCATCLHNKISAVGIFFIFSQMVNWVELNFGQQLNIIMMLLLEKFGKNPVHGSREN